MVSCAAGVLVRSGGLRHRSNCGRKLADCKPAWGKGQGQSSAQYGANSRFVDVDAAYPSPADLRWAGKFVQSVIADESGIPTIEISQEAFENLPKAGDDPWKSLEQSAAAQFFAVVDDDLETKHAFAFGIGLQSQSAEMPLEDRQVIHRCLDDGFESGLVFAIPMGACLSAEDCLELFQVQASWRAIDEPLKNLFHLSATTKDQVSTVFDLINRILIVEVAAFLFFQV